MSMLNRDRPEEVMQALAAYLEFIERGGDGETFLRRHESIAPELRALAGLDASLTFELPESLFGGREASRRKFLAAVKDVDNTARALAWFRPRLFGIFGAIGLGAGLTGAFASGALPSEPISNFIASIPVVGRASSQPASQPFQDLGYPPGSEKLEPLLPQAAPVNERPHGDNDGPDPETPLPASDRATQPDESSGSEEGPPETLRQAGESVEPNSVSTVGVGVGPEGTPPGQGGDIPAGGIGPDGTPPGQGRENPDEGVGPDGTPPGQGGDIPGGGVGPGGTPPGEGGDIPGSGVGPGGTPSGEGGDIPGGAVVPGGTPPGQGGDVPGGGVGPEGTSPGQGGENPGGGLGPAGLPPGRGGENPGGGISSDGTPPGQDGENPGSVVGPDGTPPGQGGENRGGGLGPAGLPPGRGGENPGGGISSDGTLPGQDGENPRSVVGPDGTPPGQVDDGTPGNSGNNGNGKKN